MIGVSSRDFITLPCRVAFAGGDIIILTSMEQESWAPTLPRHGSQQLPVL